ncbi:hypothetical protein BJ684DRAFT_16745 [Piptocephalis cylindrospora]|uniref:Uncharacterized protein n=1 Tax=Piptocephalis cylindrospora TaxID=1907219 RepID=A0A4P9Y2J5_9FUNG|nr:hypothetical protein BJ684DRAFT_16745 [Piptocephalis cylindrospora]|eukprot:RKP12802.1 hypothetical protein BJ684DRAFT_16745 [Piptocephalis cylindrospora]
MTGTLQRIQQGVHDQEPGYSSITPSEARTLQVVHRTFDYTVYALYTGIVVGMLKYGRGRRPGLNIARNFLVSPHLYPIVSAIPAGIIPVLGCSKLALMYIESQPQGQDVIARMREVMRDERLNQGMVAETQYDILVMLTCLMSSIRSPLQLVFTPSVPQGWSDLLDQRRKERRELFMGKDQRRGPHHDPNSVSSLASDAASQQDWSKSA